MRKPSKRLGSHQGTFGERVARERAARRRAAKARAQREEALATDTAAAVDAVAGPDIVEIPQSDLLNELSVLAALISAGLARSHPEAKRHFREQAIAVNGEPVLSDKAKLRLSDVTPEGVITLTLGAARQVLLKPV
ncbi:MAG: hypothetical protein R3D44_08640 [Hyphomicrobiaceae bacterium]